MTDLTTFEGTEVEMFELDGNMYFNPRHVGECLGMDSSTVRRHTLSMTDKQLSLLKDSDVRSTHIRKLANRGENFLTESGVYQLIFKSRKPQAERFTAWVTDEVLPSIRKTGKFEQSKQKGTSRMHEEMQALKEATSIIGMTDTAKLDVVYRVYERHNLPTDVLPAREALAKEVVNNSIVPYATPEGSAIYSLSRLLKKNDCKIGCQTFNKLMIREGLLSTSRSVSKKGTSWSTKALIGEGLKYGRNTKCYKQAGASQPYYFKHTFMELYSRILSIMPAEVLS